MARPTSKQKLRNLEEALIAVISDPTFDVLFRQKLRLEGLQLTQRGLSDLMRNTEQNCRYPYPLATWEADRS